jgi:hypothetical protein
MNTDVVGEIAVHTVGIGTVWIRSKDRVEETWRREENWVEEAKKGTTEVDVDVLERLQKLESYMKERKGKCTS